MNIAEVVKVTDWKVSGPVCLIVLIVAIVIVSFYQRARRKIDEVKKEYASRKLSTKEISELLPEDRVTVVVINEHGQPIVELVSDKNEEQFILLGTRCPVKEGRVYKVGALYPGHMRLVS